MHGWICIAVMIVGLAAMSRPALAQVYYTVNGAPVDAATAQYMWSNGLPPGHYWLNGDGYWGVVGNPVPLGNIRGLGPTDYITPQGGGEITNDGSWSYRNDTFGSNLGYDSGTGCYYTDGWSNC
jgi:hypothetical protein